MTAHLVNSFGFTRRNAYYVRVELQVRGQAFSKTIRHSGQKVGRPIHLGADGIEVSKVLFRVFSVFGGDVEIGFRVSGRFDNFWSYGIALSGRDRSYRRLRIHHLCHSF